jgi:hypothetical protein
VVDVVARLIAGRHLIGGTEYLWNSERPLFVRLLSLFHLFISPLLVWSLRRSGYDRRGLPLMIGIAAVALVLSRWLGDAPGNLNFAFRDPFLHRSLGPAPVHLLITLAGATAGAFWPTHRLLARFLRSHA